MFSERMNFRYVFDYPAHAGKIANAAPRPGERREYVVDFGKQGYCVIAVQPAPPGPGLAVIAFGSDMASLGAAGRVLTCEKLMAEMLSHLGPGSGPVRPFEALFRTQLVMNLSPKVEFVAAR